MEVMNKQIYENYRELEDLFRESINGMIPYRDEKDGLIYQVIDRADVPGNYTEASGSVMMACAIMKGCRMGVLLPEKYLDDVTKLERDAFTAAEACPRERFAARLSVWPEGFWLLYDGDRLISMVDGFMTDTPDLSDEMFADAGEDCRSGIKMQMSITAHEHKRQQDTTGRQHKRTARYNHKDSMNRQMKAGTGR